MRALVAVMVIDMLGSGLYLPVALLYFTKVSEIPLSTTGLCLSGAQVLTLAVPLVIGRTVDRLGARSVVISGLLLQAAGFVGFLFVAGPATLFVTGCLAAIGQRAYWSSIFTLVADLTSEAERDHAYGVSTAAQNAAVGAGALLASALLAVGDESVFRLVVGLDAVTFTLWPRRCASGCPGVRIIQNPLPNAVRWADLSGTGRSFSSWVPTPSSPSAAACSGWACRSMSTLYSTVRVGPSAFCSR